MRHDEIIIRAQPSFIADAVDLYFVSSGGMGASYKAAADPLTMREMDDGEMLEPTARVSTGAAQRLMDELWNAGIRPTEAKDTSGEIAAMRRHIQDLRNLVFRANDAQEGALGE